MDHDHTDTSTHLDDTTLVGDGDPRIAGTVPADGLPPRLGRYVPFSLLGAGGMGQVYAAYDTELARRVAVKVLHGGTGRRWSINAAPRLRREARALALLAHPNVVTIYDVGEVGGTLFVAMELVQGRTLGAWQRARPRTWVEVVDAYLQAGEGLAAAHAVGLVHRDFKPDNAIIDPLGRVRVLDFGLAIAHAHDDDDDDDPIGFDADTEDGVSVHARLTATGSVMGTPAYMASEQLARGEADARSDQFAFCVALFEALHGVRPFAGRTPRDLGLAIASGEVTIPPPDRKVPSWLRRLVLRGLRDDPAQRWPDMPTLLRALARGRHSRRRQHLGLAGATLLLAGLAASAAPRAIAANDPCETAAAAVERAWGPTQRQMVRTALLDSRLPYARDTWARVEPGLDAYASDWSQQRHAACEAARADDAAAAAHDRQVACLNERRAELSALVDVLGQADATVVGRAADAVARLPGLGGCEAAATPRGPEVDPARAAALRAGLGRAHAFELAGRYADGLALAQRMTTAAEALGDGAVLAEAHLRLGLLHERSGSYPEAEQAMSRAAWLAVENHHDEVAAEAMVQLTGVVGYLQARPEEGFAWGRHAQAAVARADAGGYTRARLLNNLGAIHDRRGQLVEAREHYARALELLQDPHDDVVRQLRASTLNNVGNAEARLGELARAQRDLEAAVAQTEALRGLSHPDVAIMLANLANIELDRGAFDDAARHHRRALEIRERALGPGHPQVASSRLNLGVTLQVSGRPEQARPLLERAAADKEARLGPDHHETAMALNNLGDVLRVLGEPEAAMRAHRRSRATWIAIFGEGHPMVAFAATNIGLDLLAMGRAAEAVEHLEAAIELRERSGAEPALRGVSRLGLAQAIDALGTDPERARALGRAAWQDLVDAPGRFLVERDAAHAWIEAHPSSVLADVRIE